MFSLFFAWFSLLHSEENWCSISHFLSLRYLDVFGEYSMRFFMQNLPWLVTKYLRVENGSHPLSLKMDWNLILCEEEHISKARKNMLSKSIKMLLYVRTPALILHFKCDQTRIFTRFIWECKTARKWKKVEQKRLKNHSHWAQNWANFALKMVLNPVKYELEIQISAQRD